MVEKPLLYNIMPPNMQIIFCQKLKVLKALRAVVNYKMWNILLVGTYLKSCCKEVSSQLILLFNAIFAYF